MKRATLRMHPNRKQIAGSWEYIKADTIYRPKKKIYFLQYYNR